VLKKLQMQNFVLS